MARLALRKNVVGLWRSNILVRGKALSCHQVHEVQVPYFLAVPAGAYWGGRGPKSHETLPVTSLPHGQRREDQALKARGKPPSFFMSRVSTRYSLPAVPSKSVLPGIAFFTSARDNKWHHPLPVIEFRPRSRQRRKKGGQ